MGRSESCPLPCTSSTVGIFGNLVGQLLLSTFRTLGLEPRYNQYIKLTYFNILDISDCVHIWCLKGKKASDITELDVVLSAFEKTILEYE